VHAANSVAAVVTQAIERIRIFIDVPFFKPSAIVAYGLTDRHRASHGDGTGTGLRGAAPHANVLNRRTRTSRKTKRRLDRDALHRHRVDRPPCLRRAADSSAGPASWVQIRFPTVH